MEDGWKAPRRKSAPNDQQNTLTVASTTPIVRSNSFKMPKSTSSYLTPDSAQGGASKSLPTTPVELAAMQAAEQADSSTSTAAGSTQRAKTAWTKVHTV